MGNNVSIQLLDQNPDFEEYSNGGWRSARARELDALGGLHREPIPLGQSFTAKLRFLGETLHKQGDKMQAYLAPAPKKERAKKVYPTFMLNTDRRAAERRGEVPAEEPVGFQSLTRAPPELPVTAQIREQNAAQLQRSMSLKQAPVVVADWRKRVHRSRRRAMLLVLTMVRLKRGHKHPRRFPRFSDLSFVIPNALGEHCQKFVEEQARYQTISTQISRVKAAINGTLGDPSASGKTSGHNSSGGSSTNMDGTLSVHQQLQQIKSIYGRSPLRPRSSSSGGASSPNPSQTASSINPQVQVPPASPILVASNARHGRSPDGKAAPAPQMIRRAREASSTEPGQYPPSGVSPFVARGSSQGSILVGRSISDAHAHASIACNGEEAADAKLPRSISCTTDLASNANGSTPAARPAAAATAAGDTKIGSSGMPPHAGSGARQSPQRPRNGRLFSARSMANACSPEPADTAGAAAATNHGSNCASPSKRRPSYTGGADAWKPIPAPNPPSGEPRLTLVQRQSLFSASHSQRRPSNDGIQHMQPPAAPRVLNRQQSLSAPGSHSRQLSVQSKLQGPGALRRSSSSCSNMAAAAAAAAAVSGHRFSSNGGLPGFAQHHVMPQEGGNQAVADNAATSSQQPSALYQDGADTLQQSEAQPPQPPRHGSPGAGHQHRTSVNGRKSSFGRRPSANGRLSSDGGSAGGSSRYSQAGSIRYSHAGCPDPAGPLHRRRRSSTGANLDDGVLTNVPKRQLSGPPSRTVSYSAAANHGNGKTLVQGYDANARGSQFGGLDQGDASNRRFSAPATNSAAQTALEGLQRMARQRFARTNGSEDVTASIASRPASKTGYLHRNSQVLHLNEQLEEQVDQLHQSAKMLSMYVNRCNAAWAEAQQWAPAEVASAAELGQWARGEQFTIYKADTLRKLRNGQIALQIFAGDDYMPLGLGLTQDLWGADPWALVDACRPGMMPDSDRIEGVTLGGRILCQLVLTLRELVGQEAVEKIHLLLHINEEQKDDVAQELWAHGCYGLNCNNVIIAVQQRHPGYQYDFSEQMFTPDNEASELHPMGSGYGLVQLAWASETFTLNDNGLLEPLQLPAFELLESRKVEWVVSRRCRDLALCSKELLLDMVGISYSLMLRDRARANIVVEVMNTESLVVSRQYDTVVLHCASARQQQAAAGAPSYTNATAMSDAQLVLELRYCDLVTPKLVEMLDDIKYQSSRCQLSVGLGRYMFHVSTMKAMLSSFAVFRPKLTLAGELVHVSLDLADLLGSPKARCMALEARQSPCMLTSAEHIEAMIPLIQAQDRDVAFRQMVVANQSEEDPTVTMVVGSTNSTRVGQSIVVFVANNNVTAAAVNMASYIARPGRDVIRLVTFVSTELQRAEGEELLQRHYKQIYMNMVETKAEVVIRGPYGLLDCMERYLATCDGQRTLIVMGSTQLTSNVFNYVVGSVTLSVIKRMVGVPVVVVTANSKQIPSKPGLRVLAMVESHSKDMLSYLCTSIIDVNRGDRLLLGQALATKQLTRAQQVSHRRLLDSCQTLAHSHLVPVDRTMRMDGAMDRVVCEAVEEQAVGLLGFHLPPGLKSVPPHMLSTLRSCRGATLVYQEPPAADAEGLRKSGVFKRIAH